MPEFNTEPQGETLRDALLATFALAQNDLSQPRILAITCAVVEVLIDYAIETSADNLNALTLAKANITAAHAYFSAIDVPADEAPE